MRRILISLFFLLFASGILNAQLPVVEKGKPVGRIVLSTNDAVDIKAAGLLQDFIRRISNAKLPIVHDTNTRKSDIIIGNGDLNKDIITKDITEDGFRISVSKNNLHIVSGGGYGSVYAVVTLLERYLGVGYWGEYEYSFTPSGTIVIPFVDITENPAFRYRQSQNYAMATDSVYKLWNRLKTPNEVFAANYWVHTFDKLLPSSVYGKDHPEYYSYFNGKRHPGKASQWCLTNPDVLEIVAARLDSIFKANLDKHIISVSQNDGNYTNCQCDKCKAIDEHEGAYSGSLIHFINKLAERFPDKEISTLAYLYTMKPPKHVKPRPNVNIMLCSIDCDREVSLTENASGREFVDAIEGWSRISGNIFVWDYGINFDNYLVPFPNFHILGDNIRLFKKNKATMHFSQIASSRGGDFAEMRTWLVSKLMWNPQADTDSLMNVFLRGYYGDAAPYLYRYIKVMEGALIGSGKRLWIYDSPVSHKEGMLKPQLMRRYNHLFDQAEAAVANDSVLLKRVWRTRLPLQYSELDIARTESQMNVEDISRKLDLFEQRVRLFNVPTLNERENSPVDYCELYRKRYMPADEKILSHGAKIEYLVLPTGKYASMDGSALTDGLYGGMTFTEGWIGWEGVDGSFIVDLGKEQTFTTIQTDFLHQLGAWILQPVNVTYSVSSDGKSYKTVESIDNPEDRDPQVKFVDITYTGKPINARYIKVEIAGTKVCPHWHYGVGHPCWFFIDEIVVK
ncbi:hypothetical protein GGR21_000390 [Dysgonomonas hofstadii]|uniref:F5/8 type C domain-containing protein n=1 Tax=Dysgonomonas hofstadii TaxID=637886 RepID=A0A840CND2_9BACT|nr:DUF4838 domain-containing protein [Dysgonomonas hofstadii]MBB4034505.1 hypothetical protein [Dysgonomonas hofstadii]